ncbi:MAG: EAL domain-containing protein [Acidobacteria bacterium]|nr:EAL domain-containing protein [Acidobacteriota bacterium]
MMQETGRLLVVDDEEPNRDLLSRRLKKVGFEVECAASAREALEVLEREQIDLILLDNMMPEMSGIDLLKLLRGTQSASDLPVIMVTALNDSGRVVEALSSGANDYVTKPIDFPVALARVESQLMRRRAEKLVRQNEERLALAASGANEGLFDWNLESGEVYFSDRWKELAGLPGWLGRNGEDWISQLHARDGAQVRAELQRWREVGAPERLEWEQRVRQSDGSCRWIQVKGTVQRKPNQQATRIVGSISDVTLLKAHDPLTALGNRNLLLHCLEEARQGSTLALICLDRYKLVQDNFGPAAGEKVVEEAAIRFETQVSSFEPAAGNRSVMLARLESDLFALLLGPEATAEESEDLTRRMVVALEKPMEVEGRNLFTSASVGIAVVEVQNNNFEQTLMDATTALGQAKLLGRGRIVRFEAGLRGKAIDQMELENDLRIALERNQFEVFYQPKIELASGRISGFEALLRWRHPKRGMVPPDRFIPIAEAADLMIPLGNWVLTKACQTMRGWLDEFPALPRLGVSVNVSPYQVKDGNMVERIRQVLAATGLPASALHLEVTESAFIADTKETIRIFDQIKAMGVEMNLDDFGTGYSSLQYLSDMKFDTLKIDKSFMKNLTNDTQAVELVKSMLGMAKSLEMDVVAEGVETVGQLENLKMLGCKYGQGYLFSKPVPEQEAHEILKQELAKYQF